MQLQFKISGDELYFEHAKRGRLCFIKMYNGEIFTRRHIPIKVPKETRQIFNPTPDSILNFLNKHIISQEDAKKDIAMTMYYHAHKPTFKSNKNFQSNKPIMLIGPTGSGKTYMVQKACEYMDVPFIHVDTSSMVPEGIIGYSIGDLGNDILKISENIYRAKKCVVFFDEIDKLFNSNNQYSTKVADQLLRLIEGAKLKIGEDRSLELETNNMLFILGGAFQWIHDKKKHEKQNSIYHLINKIPKRDTQISLEDLYKEHVPKELLGRMGSIVNLTKLSKDDYYKILTEGENSTLQEFIKKIEDHGDKVRISDETLEKVAQKAANSELGVRAIDQILKAMFQNALFEAPRDGFKIHTITLDC